MKGWKVLCTVNNRMQAEVLKSYLESRGINVFMQGEAAGSIYGLSSGPLAQVDLLVAEEQYGEAEKNLKGYQENDG